MICLDTNVAVAVMNKTSATVEARFAAATARETVFLSSIVVFELKFGIANSARPVENAKKLQILLGLPVDIIPFSPLDAHEAADIRTVLKRAGTPIGPYDVLIAAQARCRGATLVTANTREFAPVPRLALEDWTASAQA